MQTKTIEQKREIINQLANRGYFKQPKAGGDLVAYHVRIAFMGSFSFLIDFRDRDLDDVVVEKTFSLLKHNIKQIAFDESQLVKIFEREKKKDEHIFQSVYITKKQFSDLGLAEKCKYLSECFDIFIAF